MYFGRNLGLPAGGPYGLLAATGAVTIVAFVFGYTAASRALLEMGRARMAPAILGEIHARTRTPVIALFLNMGIGVIALVTGHIGDISS
jgi:ethanolamine permease